MKLGPGGALGRERVFWKEEEGRGPGNVCLCAGEGGAAGSS